jgi:hypothetical protein
VVNKGKEMLTAKPRLRISGGESGGSCTAYSKTWSPHAKATQMVFGSIRTPYLLVQGGLTEASLGEVFEFCRCCSPFGDQARPPNSGSASERVMKDSEQSVPPERANGKWILSHFR